ncbi:hypothetical protein AcV7_006446 [Taiwanofungus camphoratus]|nr:hypothetical protein AcV7_006446 [Antrodia cinnamomea]
MENPAKVAKETFTQADTSEPATATPAISRTRKRKRKSTQGNVPESLPTIEPLSTPAEPDPRKGKKKPNKDASTATDLVSSGPQDDKTREDVTAAENGANEKAVKTRTRSRKLTNKTVDPVVSESAETNEAPADGKLDEVPKKRSRKRKAVDDADGIQAVEPAEKMEGKEAEENGRDEVGKAEGTKDRKRRRKRPKASEPMAEEAAAEAVTVIGDAGNESNKQENSIVVDESKATKRKPRKSKKGGANRHPEIPMEDEKAAPEPKCATEKEPSPSPPEPSKSDDEDGDAGTAPEKGSEDEEDEDVPLHGFSTDDDDSSDEEVEEWAGIDVGTLPTIAKDDAIVKQKLEKAKRQPTEDRGVIYLGRIPHGFYEAQMRSYFSQFGNVTRLRLSRNKKTGRSKHYAFIEFDSSSVAEIVAETMDNYLLMGHILTCKVIPKDEVHPELWIGANRKWRVVPRDRIARVQHNKPRTEEEQEKAEKRLLKRQAQKKRKLKEAGIEYDFEAVAYKERPKPTEAQLSQVVL